MKRVVGLLFLSFLLLITSCQNSGNFPTGGVKSTEGEVEDKFAEFPAGTWEAEGPWQIVLSPDETVSSVVIPLASVEVKPHQTTEVHGHLGEPGSFEAGDIEADYSPETRQLSVFVEIKHIYMDMGDILEGKCDYYITGSISEDRKTWNADLFTMLDTVIWGRDPNSPAESPAFIQKGTLKTSLDDGPEKLVLTKVENNADKK